MKKFKWPDSPGSTAFPIAAAGYPLIAAAVFTTAVLALLGLTTLTLIGLVVTFCFCGFFRDPDRVTPANQAAVVSPADGKVISAAVVDSSAFYDGPSLKISIFMTVFNVHVNRIPHEGRVKEISYYPGKFFSANLEKASLENEHNAVFVEMENGRRLCVVQVAGLIARRIICHVKPGDTVLRGQRFGLICFGSRLDVYLPADTRLEATIGEKVRAGTSILGQLV
jgi:phosphatidylserine decarboxylase